MRHVTRKLMAITSVVVLLALFLIYDAHSSSEPISRRFTNVANEDDVAVRLLNNGHLSRHGLEDAARHSNGISHAYSFDIIARNISAGARHNAWDGIVAMIRDTAEHIKWSADEKFETDLMKKCAAKEYDLTEMPSASVILCFHGSETLTRLMHTVHSIVQHSPRQLLREVILIADHSETESHQLPLEHYIKFVFPDLVWVHRSKAQLGLIKCRQLGAQLAKGEVVVSMDSHMELRIGWLEPLLFEIHKDRKTMVSPYLDWMTEQDDGTRQYEYGCSRYKTVWYWKDMGFTFMEIPDEFKYRVDSTAPIISPVTVGVWAMDKTFFFEIGGFHTGMNLWGGENIDLPIRVVMAGGRHYNVPCSHAAHCAPKGSRDYRIGHKPEVNYRREIEALFDEKYKEAIYYYNPAWKGLDIGDISERKSLASGYKHDFAYYMANADIEHKAPNIDTLAWDGIHNLGVEKNNSKACMYIEFSTWSVKFAECKKFDRHTTGLFLTNEGQLHNSNHIIMSSLVDDHLTIGNYVGVIGTKRVDKWFHKKDGTIKQYLDPSSKNTIQPQCIEAVRQKPGSEEAFKVSLRPCEPNNEYQKWRFGTYTTDYSNFIDNNVLPRKDKVTQKYYEKYKSYLHSKNSI